MKFVFFTTQIFIKPTLIRQAKTKIQVRTILFFTQIPIFWAKTRKYIFWFSTILFVENVENFLSKKAKKPNKILLLGKIAPSFPHTAAFCPAFAVIYQKASLFRFFIKKRAKCRLPTLFAFFSFCSVFFAFRVRKKCVKFHHSAFFSAVFWKFCRFWQSLSAFFGFFVIFV